jgi:hypothetical protein
VLRAGAAPVAHLGAVLLICEKLDADDLLFGIACSDLREFGVERGDLLIVESHPKGTAATAELVLVLLRERAFVGRWLLDHVLEPIVEDDELRVIGAVTVVRERGKE